MLVFPKRLAPVDGWALVFVLAAVFPNNPVPEFDCVFAAPVVDAPNSPVPVPVFCAPPNSPLVLVMPPAAVPVVVVAAFPGVEVGAKRPEPCVCEVELPLRGAPSPVSTGSVPLCYCAAGVTEAIVAGLSLIGAVTLRLAAAWREVGSESLQGIGSVGVDGETGGPTG